MDSSASLLDLYGRIDAQHNLSIVGHNDSSLARYNAEEFHRHTMEYVEQELLGPQRVSPDWLLIFLCTVDTLILLTGIVGNSVTIWVINRNPRMYTVGVNIYLINLAVSDLVLLILGLPFEIYNLFEVYPYPFTEQVCQARAWLTEASTISSCLTILAFAVERYIAICHPFESIHFQAKTWRAALAVIMIWIVAFCAAAVLALAHYVYEFPYPTNADWTSHLQPGTLIPESAICTARAGQTEIVLQISTFLFFFAPMLIIIVLHILITVHLRRLSHNLIPKKQSPADDAAGDTEKTQAHKAILRMLVAIGVAFFLCYAPFHVQRLHSVYEKDWNSVGLAVNRVLLYISGVFYYGAATVNPFLYSILSARFRQACRSSLGACLGQRYKRFQARPSNTSPNHAFMYNPAGSGELASVEETRTSGHG
ncbi:neuropeptides capa receptor-like isoform X2 [Paramacrobiotus metropolitanus]|uniref:neuropeptides capa receptor-like isoform X2 n=1 Tax=Paramacrobiotus metropolitanus TaxID=2943436 RepID=UPI0024465436|nr:neuropeptides capa receptor-like isoform X2 [Paramacrobiotus metropolitanus]